MAKEGLGSSGDICAAAMMQGNAGDYQRDMALMEAQIISESTSTAVDKPTSDGDSVVESTVDGPRKGQT